MSHTQRREEYEKRKKERNRSERMGEACERMRGRHDAKMTRKWKKRGKENNGKDKEMRGSAEEFHVRGKFSREREREREREGWGKEGWCGEVRRYVGRRDGTTEVRD